MTAAEMIAFLDTVPPETPVVGFAGDLGDPYLVDPSLGWMLFACDGAPTSWVKVKQPPARLVVMV
jgi:hypothetical protein